MGWSTIFGLAAIFAFAGSQYTTGLTAVFACALCAVRYNGVLKPAFIVGVVLVTREFWPDYINWVYGLETDYGATEAVYRDRSLQKLADIYPDVWGLVRYWALGFAGYFFVNGPVMTLLGSLGLFGMIVRWNSPSHVNDPPRRRDIAWLLFTFCLLPVLMYPLYVGDDLAKGYISFATSDWCRLGNATTRTPLRVFCVYYRQRPAYRVSNCVEFCAFLHGAFPN